MANKLSELILLETNHWLIVNKPAGLSSLDEHLPLSPSLLKMAKAHDESLRLCHRLDKYTSGCLVLAKNDEAYRHLAMQFEARKVDKTYHAVVNGRNHFDNRKIEVALLKKKNNKAAPSFDGKAAVTVVNNLEEFGHYTLVECKPETGRYHQIRAHLAWTQSPIAGDSLYGSPTPLLSEIKRKYRAKDYEEERPMISRYALHAEAIEFSGMDGALISAQAPYPKDLNIFLKVLRKYDKLA